MTNKFYWRDMLGIGYRWWLGLGECVRLMEAHSLNEVVQEAVRKGLL